eukprot:TRINITY_DN4865_c0_g1_i1.p1 TRINITY_DN4865_c0_g1~~TRINITY_DN4865_c0_g1_i1.p1  ORF type:complete len:279 (+),score=95.37 TRINITY_DN4865_c0_g1_i1:44-838(+)
MDEEEEEEWLRDFIARKVATMKRKDKDDEEEEDEEGKRKEKRRRKERKRRRLQVKKRKIEKRLRNEAVHADWERSTQQLSLLRSNASSSQTKQREERYKLTLNLPLAILRLFALYHRRSQRAPATTTTSSALINTLFDEMKQTKLEEPSDDSKSSTKPSSNTESTSMDKLIEIRWGWDRYIVAKDSGGTRIPDRFLTETRKPSSNAWALALSKNMLRANTPSKDDDEDEEAFLTRFEAAVKGRLQQSSVELTTTPFNNDDDDGD